MAEPRVAVVGAGAAGLTSACRLLEVGYAVTVVARDLPPHTTSDVAAAFWSSSAVLGSARVRDWALASLDTFRELAANPEAGVDLLDLFELAAEPLWPPDLPGVRVVQPGEFAQPWQGYVLNAPRIDVPSYMPWLLDRVRKLGATVLQQDVASLDAVTDEFEITVNASGLGAGKLASDAMFPIRGQVMRVRRPEGLPNRILHAERDGVVTYIVPRRSDCLLGGTYQFHESSLDVDEALASAIVERCTTLEPALGTVELLGHRVGLRPGRASVRLEREVDANDRLIVHNYGHASIGHTLSWGCAAEVLHLIQTA